MSVRVRLERRFTAAARYNRKWMRFGYLESTLPYSAVAFAHGIGVLLEAAIDSLMRLSPEKSVTNKTPQLANGQIWKTKDFLVQIVQLGKVLVHYKLLKDVGQMRRVQISRIESMEEYLRTNGACLLEAA